MDDLLKFRKIVSKYLKRFNENEFNDYVACQKALKELHEAGFLIRMNKVVGEFNRQLNEESEAQ
jgi:hypothetical protein